MSGRRHVSHPPLEQFTLTREFKVHGSDTKFYGRRAQLEVLYNAIRDAVNDRACHVVSITGKGGLGKSRLVYEFISLVDIAGRGITFFSTDSVEDETDVSLRFTDQVLRQRFAVDKGMGEQDIRDRIERGLRGIVDGENAQDAVRLLSHLVGLALPEGSRPHEALPSDTFQQRAMATFVNLIGFEATRRPLILVVDAFEHAPSRTRAAVQLMTHALKNTPSVILAVSRKAIPADLFGGAVVTPMSLTKLPDPMMTKTLRHLLRRVPDLPDGLVERTVKRAKGNPALLEDIVRLMLQRGILVDLGERWELRAEKLSKTKLPGTTGAVAKARVDELSETDRALLEMASVFGPVFWFGGLLSMVRLERRDEDHEGVKYWVSDKRESRLNAALVAMQSSDLVEFRNDSGLPEQVAFAFVNPIEQQRLYAGLVDARRKMLHRTAAQWLEQVVPRDNFQLVEIIAWHFEQGDCKLRAGAAYSRAGGLARATYQNRRAADLYRRALEFYDTASSVERCAVYQELIDLHILLGEYGEATRLGLDMLYYSTVACSQQLGGQAYLRLGQAMRAQGDYSASMEYFERGLKLFQDVSHMAGIAHCLDDIGKLHWYRGEYGSYKQALSYFLKSLSLRRKLMDEQAIASSLGNIGNIHLARGQIPQASESFGEALEIRRQLDDRWGLALTLIGMGAVHHELHDFPSAEKAWMEGLRIAGEVGDRELTAILQNNLGEAYLDAKNLEKAEALLASAHETTTQIGDKRTMADVLRNKACLARTRGHYDRALSLVMESLSISEELNAKQLIGHGLRTQGEILGDTLKNVGSGGFQVPDADKHASNAFQRSMAYFEEMGDTLGLARTMRSYGSYLKDRGVGNKARKLLARADEVLAQRAT